MSTQKLHYENISGTLVRREGLLSWRCPLCKAEGQSPGVMHTCPECGSKDATLPGAQPAPSVPDGWKLVPIEPTEEMIKAANNTPIPAVYLDSISAMADIRTKACYRAMLAAAQPAPIVQDVPAKSLKPVIDWLRNGCDPMKAADELELLIAAAAPEAKP